MDCVSYSRTMGRILPALEGSIRIAACLRGRIHHAGRRRVRLVHRGRIPSCTCILAVLLLRALAADTEAQISSARTALIQDGIGARVEALTILGGDLGLSDGNFHSADLQGRRTAADVDTSVSKFGGDGDVGNPRPLGDLSIDRQPRLQGNMGYLESTRSVFDRQDVLELRRRRLSRT